MSQTLQSDLHSLSRVKEGERVVFTSDKFEVKPKYSFWLLDWLLGRAKLGKVFDGIRQRLAVEGLDTGGVSEERLIEDLSGLRTQVQRMKRRYDRKHGFLYKLFFDQDVDVNYDGVMRQVDFLLACLAKRELDDLHLHVEGQAALLRSQMSSRWQEERLGLDRQIEDLAAQVNSGKRRVIDWKDKAGAGSLEDFWRSMWDRLEHAIGEGGRIGRLIEEETTSGFDSVKLLSINHHNEIVSKLVTWEGIVKEERRRILRAMQQWNQERSSLLEDLQAQYERAEDREGVERLKNLFVKREQVYLGLLEDAQQGLGEIADELQDGIRRLGRVLMTDEYLDARVAA